MNTSDLIGTLFWIVAFTAFILSTSPLLVLIIGILVGLLF